MQEEQKNIEEQIPASPSRQRGILRQTAAFLWRRKMYWLVPVIVCLAAVGALMFVGQGSVLSPFIYALF